MAVTNKLDRFQQRHPAAGFPLGVFTVISRHRRLPGCPLTYYAFVSLFPLLLLTSTVLGDVLAVTRASSTGS